MRSLLLLGCALLVASLVPASSSALPRFALITGAKCGSCHVNPTGGQMRTDFGTKWGDDKLPLEATKDTDFAINPQVSDNLSFGFDYRSQFIYDQHSQTSTFQAMTTALYGDFRLSRRVSFYFKQDIINGTYGGLYNGLYNGTEVYGLLRIVPGSWYVKGGSFLPDFGWRLDDHTAYTRGGDLGFTGAGFHPGLMFVPNYHDIGVEVGGYLGDLMITSGLFNGTGQTAPIDFDKDKAYTVKLQYMSSLSSLNFLVGASGYGFRSYKIGGIMAGFATGDSNLVFTGEVDWTHNAMAGTTVVENIDQMAVYAELDYRAIQGLWVTGKFDAFDPLEGISDDPAGSPSNSVQRVTLGFEFFPFPFVEVRPQYRIVIQHPSNDNNVALVQFHLWF